MKWKVGRNDPCPCGSGRKYKKCCLFKERAAGAGTKPSHNHMEHALKWIFSNEMLRDEFKSVINDYARDKPLGEFEMGLLSNAFVFDYRLPENGMRPFEYFMKNSQLSPDDRLVYEGFSRNSHSIFEVLEVRRDEGLKLKDVINEREYWVKDKEGTRGAKQGNIICCRIAPYRDHFVILGPGALSWPQDAGYLFKRNLEHLRAEAKEHPLTAFDALKILVGWKSKGEESPENIKKAMKKKLDELGIKMDFRSLAKRINESKTLREAFPEVFEFDFPSNRDCEETLRLLQDLWNNFPRREFGGLTPSEKAAIGPKEEMLLHALTMETQRNIDPGEYPTVNDAQRAADEFRDKWLRTPQEELGRRTPMDVILEERAVLGNPNKEFTMRIEISPSPDYDANEAERFYREGLEAFKSGAWIKAARLFKQVTEMYPENYRAWGNLGSCYANLGGKRDAIECYEKALSIEPNYELAKKNLAAIRDVKEEDLVMMGLAGAIKGVEHSMSTRRSWRKDKRAENNE